MAPRISFLAAALVLLAALQGADAAAPTEPEARKKMVAERAATLPADEAGKKEYAAQAREGFMNMYSSYCAHTGFSGDAATQRTNVCNDAGLKKMYEAYAAGTSKGKSSKSST